MNTPQYDELKSLLFGPISSYLNQVLISDSTEDNKDPSAVSDHESQNDTQDPKDVHSHSSRLSIRDREVHIHIKAFSAALEADETIRARIKQACELSGTPKSLVYFQEYKRWLFTSDDLQQHLDLPESERNRFHLLICSFKVMWRDLQPWIDEYDWLSLLAQRSVFSSENTQINHGRRTRIRRRARLEEQRIKPIDWNQKASIPSIFFKPEFFGLVWLSHTPSIHFLTRLIFPIYKREYSIYHFMKDKKLDEDLGELLIKLLGNLQKKAPFVLNYDFWKRNLKNLSAREHIFHVQEHMKYRAKQERQYFKRKFKETTVDLPENLKEIYDNGIELYADKNILHQAETQQNEQAAFAHDQQVIIATFKKRRAIYSRFCDTLTDKKKAGIYDFLILLDRFKFVMPLLKQGINTQQQVLEIETLIEKCLPWGQTQTLFDRPLLLSKLNCTREDLWSQAMAWSYSYDDTFSLQAWVNALQHFDAQLTASAWDRARARLLKQFQTWCHQTDDLDEIRLIFNDVLGNFDEIDLSMAQEISKEQ